MEDTCSNVCKGLGTQMRLNSEQVIVTAVNFETEAEDGSQLTQPQSAGALTIEKNTDGDGKAQVCTG